MWLREGRIQVREPPSAPGVMSTRRLEANRTAIAPRVRPTTQNPVFTPRDDLRTPERGAIVALQSRRVVSHRPEPL